MSIFEAIIQGIVQGATEFLPVSSSGHLSLAQHIMGVKVDSLLFDILLHLGTLIAVCAVYYKLIWRLIKAFISLVADVFHGKFKWKDMDHDRRLLMMLMIGLIPLFLLFLPVPGTGMKLKDISELWASDSTIWIEGLALLMTSALLFLGIRASKGAKVHRFTRKDGKVGEIRGRTKFHTADAICVGVTQCAAAVFPGLSRSGSTMAAGLLRGINQQAALDYSFVLGIPSILAAAVLTIKCNRPAGRHWRRCNDCRRCYGGCCRLPRHQAAQVDCHHEQIAGFRLLYAGARRYNAHRFRYRSGHGHKSFHRHAALIR